MRAPFADRDGSPVFFGSAFLGRSIHPCKVAPRLPPCCRVPFGGSEVAHHGRYDLLPFTPDTMELVTAAYGQLPPGRRPVEGGYEENGARLYHAVAVVDGVRVPGKTGEHLVSTMRSHLESYPNYYQTGCHVAYGNRECVINENYEVL